MMNIMAGSRVIHCMVTEVMQQFQCPWTKLCYLDDDATSAGDIREMNKGEQTKKTLKGSKSIIHSQVELW